MRVFELGEMILLDLERDLTDTVRTHLDTFVIAEDVVVADVTGTFAQLGLYGPGAAGILDLATAAEPSAAPAFVLPGGDIGVSGVELIVPGEAVGTLASALERSGAVPIDRETVEVTRLEAGIPRFLVDMDSTTIPLEAGIEDRAISLTKGCYVGQEVIIRVLHRGGGRVAKKLVGLVAESGGIQRDVRVFSADREVGRVTSAVDSPRVGKRIALAYVHRDFIEPGTELIAKASEGDVSVRVARLPFER
jgi:folate-binding protein YgfZ